MHELKGNHKVKIKKKYKGLLESPQIYDRVLSEEEINKKILLYMLCGEKCIETGDHYGKRLYYHLKAELQWVLQEGEPKWSFRLGWENIQDISMEGFCQEDINGVG